MSADLLEVLAAAQKALKPAFVPMRSIRATETGYAEAILIEAHQTLLPRLLTFVNSSGKRLVILAYDRRVHSARSTDGGKVEREAAPILETLKNFTEDQTLMTVASAPPADSSRPSGAGFQASELLAELKTVGAKPIEEEPSVVESEDVAEDELPEDNIEALRQKLTNIFQGVAVRSKYGRIAVKSEDKTLDLEEHIETATADILQRQNFLDEAIPGPKLILHAGIEKSDAAVAYTMEEDKTLLATFDAGKLAQAITAWQTISKVKKAS